MTGLLLLQMLRLLGVLLFHLRCLLLMKSSSKCSDRLHGTNSINRRQDFKRGSTPEGRHESMDADKETEDGHETCSGRGCGPKRFGRPRGQARDGRNLDMRLGRSLPQSASPF